MYLIDLVTLIILKSTTHIGPQFMLKILKHVLTFVLHFVQFILKRDLRGCPAFNKLKTLVLAEWCVDDDYCSLICILQHTPALEILTIQLYKVLFIYVNFCIFSKFKGCQWFMLLCHFLQPLERKPDNTVPSKTVYNNSMNQSFLPENLKGVPGMQHRWWEGP